MHTTCEIGQFALVLHWSDQVALFLASQGVRKSSFSAATRVRCWESGGPKVPAFSGARRVLPGPDLDILEVKMEGTSLNALVKCVLPLHQSACRLGRACTYCGPTSCHSA
jgi:hypothetical protein